MLVQRCTFALIGDGHQEEWGIMHTILPLSLLCSARLLLWLVPQRGCMWM